MLVDQAILVQIQNENTIINKHVAQLQASNAHLQSELKYYQVSFINDPKNKNLNN